MSQQERFSIECLESSPNSSFWPIAKDTADPVNQSNFHDQIGVAKQRAGKHARENTNGFGFLLIG